MDLWENSGLKIVSGRYIRNLSIELPNLSHKLILKPCFIRLKDA